MTRFRPRFSLRTLAIFMTLACAYFAAWEVTKREAEIQPNWIYSRDGTKPRFSSNDDFVVQLLESVERGENLVTVGEASSPIPLVIARLEISPNGAQNRR